MGNRFYCILCHSHWLSQNSQLSIVRCSEGPSLKLNYKFFIKISNWIKKPDDERTSINFMLMRRQRRRDLICKYNFFYHINYAEKKIESRIEFDWKCLRVCRKRALLRPARQKKSQKISKEIESFKKLLIFLTKSNEIKKKGRAWHVIKILKLSQCTFEKEKKNHWEHLKMMIEFFLCRR